VRRCIKSTLLMAPETIQTPDFTCECYCQLQDGGLERPDGPSHRKQQQQQQQEEAVQDSDANSADEQQNGSSSSSSCSSPAGASPAAAAGDADCEAQLACAAFDPARFEEFNKQVCNG
jgi:hypothetical protein